MLRNKKPVIFQPDPLERIWLHPHADPLGSYTGVPDDPKEIPIQDADDL